jgi:hypothetical protein
MDRTASAKSFPYERRTSTGRNFATNSSGVGLFVGIFVLTLQSEA